MATETEEFAAYKALCDQYEASGRELAADPTNGVVRTRRRHLAEEIDAMRTHWRGIGAFVGDRPVDVRGRSGVGVKITNNDGSEPS